MWSLTLVLLDGRECNERTHPERVSDPGLEPVTGDLKDWKTENGVDAWELVSKNAISVAAGMIKGGVKKVTIRGVRVYPGDQTNMNMPHQWTDVVTADNLAEMTSEYDQKGGKR